MLSPSSPTPVTAAKLMQVSTLRLAARVARSQATCFDAMADILEASISLPVEQRTADEHNVIESKRPFPPSHHPSPRRSAYGSQSGARRMQAARLVDPHR